MDKWGSVNPPTLPTENTSLNISVTDNDTDFFCFVLKNRMRGRQITCFYLDLNLNTISRYNATPYHY